MKIDCIYINTYKYDYHFSLIAVSSVRYWYPEIPIFLIKDLSKGDFSTDIIERIFNVKIYNSSRKKFGWGFGKWEPMFDNRKHSFLVLDADTAIVGPILDHINEEDADFIVDFEIQESKDRFNEIYYDRTRILEINPNFRVPEYSFNEGQWFGTSCLLTREDFDHVLYWSEPPVSKFPEIIKQGAQGPLNYALELYSQNRLIKLARKSIMYWPNEEDGLKLIQMTNIKQKNTSHQFIIHWAGYNLKKYNQLPHFEIIKFYTEFYFSKLNSIEKLKIRYQKKKYFMERTKSEYKKKILSKLKKYNILNA
jgi:hypothetical protein